MGLVPHLIATYLSGNDGLWNCDGRTESTLLSITLEGDLYGPAEWATWWLEEHGN